MVPEQPSTKKMVKEKEYQPASGWLGLFGALGLMVGGVVLFAAAAAMRQIILVPVAILMAPAGFISLFGLMAVAPNTARVLVLFGVYKGSVKTSGFYWVNPFFSKKKISLRVRNFETGSTAQPEKRDPTTLKALPTPRSGGKPSKVNDRDGNPIDISAVVVWRVMDTAEAVFEVDDYEDYVAVQSESALRVLASRHPYDSEDHEISLRGNVEDIADSLRRDIQERLDTAGIQVVEARISHLAYASEIAAAMLQRQQAKAMIAARTLIVDGAVGMVEMALERIAREKIVELDPERRAAMVSNLLVVLCSGSQAHPVINTGTLYQ